MDKKRRIIFLLVTLLCMFVFSLLILWFPILFEPRKLNSSDYVKIKKSLDYNPTALYKFDADISYMLKPNFEGIRHGSNRFVHRTNSRSLLGDSEINSPSDIIKVLFLGDSVAYGHGIPYESTLVFRMQKLAGKKYQLADGSCPGWSTKQEIGFYEKYVSDINWKAIVVIFCLNDLVNFEWIYDSETVFKQAAELENIANVAGLTGLVESMKLWNICRRFNANTKTAPLGQHNNTCLFAWEKSKWGKYFKDVLLPFVKRTDRPPLIIIAMPTRLQIEALKLGASQETVLYPQDQLRAFCNKYTIPFFDPSHFFLKKNIEKVRLFRDDLHLSEQGHEIMANYLWPMLEEKLTH